MRIILYIIVLNYVLRLILTMQLIVLLIKLQYISYQTLLHCTF